MPKANINFNDKKFEIEFDERMSQDQLELNIKQHFNIPDGNEIDMSSYFDSKPDVQKTVSDEIDVYGNLFRGFSGIVASLPKATVGVPLKQYGEVIKESDNFDDVIFDNRLDVEGKTNNLLSTENIKKFSTSIINDMIPYRKSFGIANVVLNKASAFIPIDDALIEQGQKVIDWNDNVMMSLGLGRPSKNKANQLSYDIGSGFGSVALSIGLAAMGAPEASVGLLFGAMTNSDMYENARAKGLDAKKATDFSLLGGTFVAATEAIGLNIFMKHIDSSNFLRATLLRTAENSIQEQIQTLGQDILENISGAEQHTWQKILKDVAYSGLISAITSAPASMVVTHLQSEGTMKHMKELGIGEETSKTILLKAASDTYYKNKEAIGQTIKQVSEGVFVQDLDGVRKKIIQEYHEDYTIADPTPSVEQPNVSSPQNIDDTYSVVIQNAKEQAKFTYQAKELWKDTASKINRLLDSSLVSLSTRLYKISPRLHFKFVQHEHNIKKAIIARSEKVSAFAKKYVALPIEKRAMMAFALLNSQGDTIKAISGEHGFADEMREVRKMYRETFIEATDVGFNVNEIKEYYARKVKPSKVQDFLDLLNEKGLKEERSEIDQAFAKFEEESGKKLTNEEKADLMNSYFRGFAIGKVLLAGPKNFKHRSLGVITPDMVKYFEDPINAMYDYIIAASEAIENKKFLGKSNNVEESLGAIIQEELGKKLTPAEERELKDVVMARFNAKGAHGLFATYRNLEYIATLGNIFTSVRQISEMYLSTYKNGIFQTIDAFMKVLEGNNIDISETGISDIGSEFASASRSSKMVEQTLKWSGLTFFDKFSKNVFTTAMYGKLKSMSKEVLFNKYKEALKAEELERLYNDLQSGELTNSVSEILFYELAGVQPVTLLENPAMYVKGGNARVLYSLKTFGIKTLDILRRDVFLQKNKVKAAENLFKFLLSWIALGVPVEVMIAFMKGSEIDIPMETLDKLLDLILFNRYSMQKAKQEGLGSAILAKIKPSTKLLDSLSTGKPVRVVPLFGESYYQWFQKKRSNQIKLI